MPTVNVDYDHVPTADEPTEAEMSYEEMGPLAVAALARSGDKDAVAFLNSRDASRAEK